jgi:hypothetical protein
MELQKNKPSPESCYIITLCHGHPGSSIDMLAELSGLPRAEVYTITKTQRNNGNLATAKAADGTYLRACYVTTPKGRANVGIAEPTKVKQCTQSAIYTSLVYIPMVSHRPGAWDANAIARRGLAC